VLFISTIPSFYEKFRGYIHSNIFVNFIDFQLFERLQRISDSNDTFIFIPKLDKYDEQSLKNWFNSNNLVYLSSLINRRLYYGNEIVQFDYENLGRTRIRNISYLMRAPMQSARFDILQEFKQTNTILYIISEEPNLMLKNGQKIKLIDKSDHYYAYEVLSL
jgi:hypothetical protein